MIREIDLLEVKHRFKIYTNQFFTGDEKTDSAIALKIQHSTNVAGEILALANSLDLDKEHCYLAEILALLHDIGRFEQYSTYHTYSDRRSEDHAVLGVEAIERTGIIGNFSAYEQDLIKNVVLHHNRASLPFSGDEEFLFLLKLLRDADKIDILHMVTRHYAGFCRNEAITIGLPDTPEISDEIIHRIMKCTSAKVQDVKTINDFKLLQASWVFDLNFPRTCEIFRQRRYLEKLSAALPRNSRVAQAMESARIFLLRKHTIERRENECRIP
jgi:putative nucleotidyltransferase with HDIG domain